MWSRVIELKIQGPINTKLESISSYDMKLCYRAQDPESDQYRARVNIELETQRPTNTKTDQDRAKRQRVVVAALGERITAGIKEKLIN